MVWGLGLAGACVVFVGLDRHVVKIVSYKIQPLTAPAVFWTYTAPVAVAAALVALVYWRRATVTPLDDRGGIGLARSSVTAAGLPMLAATAVATYWLADLPPPLPRDWATVWAFISVCTPLVGVAWSIDRLGDGVAAPGRLNRTGLWAPALLLLAIVISTCWHTAVQINFWRHFMLGYADFGFFTTELEHCLPWKDVGPLRFSDTRMGYHCVPMFYLLTPFYAMFRSPVFLMVIGPLALNLAAVPFYQLAKHRSGSDVVALLVALAWLALPSLSRLAYANTYGFQSIYLAVPWLAFCFCCAMRGRWGWSHVFLAGAMLCEETVCGVAFGWGVYLSFFSRRGRDGAVIATVSIVYLLLCTTVIIPHFDVGSEYTRLELIGDVSFAVAVERITRPQLWCYMAALAAPLLPGLRRHWRLLIAAAPTSLLITLMRETEYLSIKFWHHSSVLVVLFVAATLGVTRSASYTQVNDRPRFASIGPALGLMASALLFHQLMGFTPMAQSYRVYAANSKLHVPDGRMALVEQVRSRFPPDGYTVIATERMAAHFIDYRMVLPTPDVHIEDTMSSPHLLVFDRSDGWDRINTRNQTEDYLRRALEVGYAVVYEDGPVMVLANNTS